jgi:hypothetical protein
VSDSDVLCNSQKEKIDDEEKLQVDRKQEPKEKIDDEEKLQVDRKQEPTCKDYDKYLPFLLTFALLTIIQGLRAISTRRTPAVTTYKCDYKIIEITEMLQVPNVSRYQVVKPTLV